MRDIQTIKHLFFKPRHKANILMKSNPEGKAIKNSADEDPEGYSIVLDPPLCDGGSRTIIYAIHERPDVNKVSMKRKEKKFWGRKASIYRAGAELGPPEKMQTLQTLQTKQTCLHGVCIV